MNVPAEHGEHTRALPTENVPARHKTGWVPLARQAKPGGHGDGAMAPDRINGGNTDYTFTPPNRAKTDTEFKLSG